MRTLGGPELGDGQLFVGGFPVGETPGSLVRGEAYGLGVDVGIGCAVGHGLEGRYRRAELLALTRVGGGEAQRGLADTGLHGTQRGEPEVCDPLGDLGSPVHSSHHVVDRHEDRIEGEVR